MQELAAALTPKHAADGATVVFCDEVYGKANGDPVPRPGTRPDPSAATINNGITGDGRRSSAELGRKLFDMKVDYAVRQVQQLPGK